MPCSVLNSVYVLSHKIFTTSQWVGYHYPILHMNKLRNKMAKPFVQRHTVPGLEFKPSFISSREVNDKLPKVIISVTQVSCSVEARQNSPRIWNLSCAWVQSQENEQYLCCGSLDFNKERKSVSQVLESLRQARNCYQLWYVHFSLAGLLTKVTKRWPGEVVGRRGMPSPPSVQWRGRNKRKICWRGLQEKWYLPWRDGKMYK